VSAAVIACEVHRLLTAAREASAKRSSESFFGLVSSTHNNNGESSTFEVFYGH